MELRIEENDHGATVRIRNAHLEARIREWAYQAGGKVVDAFRIASPKRSGRLAASWRSSVDSRSDGADVRVWTDVPYAGFVVKGTRAHRIAPHGGNALHWTDSMGRSAFAEFINHPGTRPNNFPARALDSIDAELRQSFRSTVTRGL